jgi:DNA modification methylase
MVEWVEIGNARLALGDCREILPTLSGVDAVVTDPPYGVDGATNTRTANRGYNKNGYASFVDSVDYVSSIVVPVIEDVVKRGWRVVMTPGNRCFTLYPRPVAFGAVFQPASVGLQPWGKADCQPILYYGKSPYGGKELPSQSCAYVLTETAVANGHPCPKPERFWTKIVQSASRDGETVIDPFMGSGTTGVACAKLGRRFIGIEIEPRYFDIACRRIEEAQRQQDMFVTPTPKAEQLGMFGDVA